jgi:hypothetical protein
LEGFFPENCFVFGSSMAMRALHAIADSIRPYIQAQTNYHYTPSAETTELNALTARSHDDVSFNATSPARDTSVNGEVPTRARKPASIKRYTRLLSGWRFGVLHFTTWALIVFVINLVITVWRLATHAESRGILKEGECGHIKSLNSGLHVLINVLSTILLSGSNYCMQCLSAPTRGEVDKAHAARKWLDIGVPSVRNLRHINPWRTVLWFLLGMRYVPLHLL